MSVELAEKVGDLLATNPTLTINLLASQTSSTVDQITEVLDEYQVTEEGIVHLGPGQGGGWVPPSEFVLEEKEIGWRHPDGSIQDTPYVPEEN